MDQIKEIITVFQKKLLSLGFSDEQMATILYEIILIASAKLSEADLTFLTPEELEFVSNKDLLELSPEQLGDITMSSANLSRYLEIYSDKLKDAIREFDGIVDDVRKEELEATHPQE